MSSSRWTPPPWRSSNNRVTRAQSNQATANSSLRYVNSTSSHLAAAAIYLRQPARIRIYTAILLTALFMGAMIWSFATVFNGRHTTDIPQAYRVSTDEGQKNLAAFVLLMAGGFWITYLLIGFFVALGRRFAKGTYEDLLEFEEVDRYEGHARKAR